MLSKRRRNCNGTANIAELFSDWVQDAAREQARRKSRRKKHAGLFDSGQLDWRHRVRESYDAAQGWIVVTIIGAAIGLNAAFLNIVTEWLADIKLGYCTTAFYLNENFCCMGEDNGCADWHRWTPIAPVNYIIYIAFAVSIYPLIEDFHSISRHANNI